MAIGPSPLQDGAMTAPPLRCHLLIGPPGSGKTTLAHALAPLLRGAAGEAGLVLSTDAIRAELFGDAAVQGPWDEIRALLLQRLRDAVAAGRPVIVDATHARRPWRLLYTQQLELPRPVEWIGWWLKTPRATCLQWAQQRERPVPPAVIEEFYASLNHRFFKPDRSEGFAAIVSLNPAAGEGRAEYLQVRLDGLNDRIRNGLNRQQSKVSGLHHYSRLLDLERLLFLIRLLSSFNSLDESDPDTASALRQICNPLPQGDLAERAAAYLSHWKDVHGGSGEVYGDAAAIRADLAWLELNGFFRLDHLGDPAIELGEAGPLPGSSVNGGYPALAERPVFRRVFTLLRHILKEPFDAPDPDGRQHALENGAAGSSAATAGSPPRARRARRDSSEFSPLYRHLIDRLSAIEGSYGEEQEAAMRYDIEHVLRPYGFLPQVTGRPHSVRQGYAIGTALLSADHLLEIHALLKASLERLSDASQLPLLQTLEDRLQRAGVLEASGVSRQFRHPKRALANRSYTDNKHGTLADPAFNARIERAIRDRRRVYLRHLPDSVSEAQRQRRDDGRFCAWPLQLLFHNISWYLAFETSQVGHTVGLIRCLRVDRLVLLSEDGNVRRSSEAEHGRALERLQRLLHVCGGLYFGESIDAQLAVMPDYEAQGLESPYSLLRFSCTPEVFSLIREEPRRFPPEHTAYAKPMPGDGLGAPGPRDTLAPNPASDSHPYPVELRLPEWTVAHDWDLRNWLFRWGAGVRIEHPTELRDKQLQQAREVVELYRDDTAEA